MNVERGLDCIGKLHLKMYTKYYELFRCDLYLFRDLVSYYLGIPLPKPSTVSVIANEI